MDNFSRLKIFAINVNSIVTSNRKLMFIEYMKRTGGDIYMVSETKLGNASRFNLLNFNILRSDRSIGAGGVALIFKKDIRFRNVKKPNTTIESVSAELLIDNKWICFISSYFGNSIIDEDIKKIINIKTPFLLGGDLNSRHVCTGDISSNYNGLILKRMVDNNNLSWKFANGATCYRSTSGSKIDHFIFSAEFPFTFTNIELTDTFSDHFGIGIDIYIAGIIQNSKTKIKLFNRTGIKNMNKSIENELNNIGLVSNSFLSNETIDIVVDKIGSIFKTAIEKYVPEIEIKQNYVIISAQTRNLRKKLHGLNSKIFRNHISDKNSIAFRNILTQHKLLKNCYLNSLSNDVNMHYKNLLIDIESTYNIYGHIKKHTAYGKKRKLPNLMFIDDDKKKTIENQQTAINEMANNFEKNHNISVKMKSDMENVVNREIKKLKYVGNCLIFNDNLRAENSI